MRILFTLQYIHLLLTKRDIATPSTLPCNPSGYMEHYMNLVPYRLYLALNKPLSHTDQTDSTQP
jgi:hypothetical protein